jgi:hypothetical protein
VAPRPREKRAKVLEIKELSLDFGCDYGTKVESPACAGLGFFLVLFYQRCQGVEVRSTGLDVPLDCENCNSKSKNDGN